jgi:hypothetical protein
MEPEFVELLAVPTRAGNSFARGNAVEVEIC